MPIALGRRQLFVLAAVVLVAAVVNFALGLGSTSLFVDESFSWIVASHPVREIYSQVKLSEVAPPGFYLLLHAWLQIGGSMTEAWLRIPSIVAGLGLVAATSWLASLVAGRAAAACSAVLVAASPLVLTYAQEARAYVFVMLATTLAVGFAVRADQRREASRGWLAASAAFGVAAIWLDYICLPVVIPLAAWVASRHALPARVKAVYLGLFVVAQALVTPLLVHQASTGNPGADAYAHLTVLNAFSVLGSPVDGRYESHLPAVIVATAAILAASGVMAVGSRRSSVTWLLLAGALAPGLALFAITIVAKPVLITRYCTVAAPFALVVLAVAATRRPVLGGIPLVAVFVTAIIGSVGFHQPSSRWPDVGAAYAVAGAHWHASDRLVLSAGIDPNLTSAPLVIYYTDRYLPRGTKPVVEPSSPQLLDLLRQRRRLWLVSSRYVPGAVIDDLVRPDRYRVAQINRFTSQDPIQVTLLAPD